MPGKRIAGGSLVFKVEADASKLPTEVKAAAVRASKASDVTLGVRLDTRQADREIANLRDRFRTATTIIGGVVTGGTLAAGLKDAVKAASGLGESINKAQVIFGSAEGAVESFGNTAAKTFGLSKQQALDFAGGFGAFTKQLGDQQRSAEASIELTKRAADIASLFNVSQEQAAGALRSGLAGESEPLRQFGVLLTEAKVKAEAYASGIAKAGTELTEVQKVQARYNLVLRESAVAQGDYGRTSGSLPNQIKAFKAELADTAATLGSLLIPTVVRGVGVLTTMLKPLEFLTAESRKASKELTELEKSVKGINGESLKQAAQDAKATVEATIGIRNNVKLNPFSDAENKLRDAERLYKNIKALIQTDPASADVIIRSLEAIPDPGRRASIEITKLRTAFNEAHIASVLAAKGHDDLANGLPPVTKNTLDFVGALKKEQLAQIASVEATNAVKNAKSQLATDQAELNRLQGKGAEAAIDAAEKSLAAAQAKRSEVDASKAIAAAKKNEQTVSVAADKAIVAAQKAANDEIAKRSGLQRDLVAALRTATDATADLAAKNRDVDRAAQDYNRTLGLSPALIDDVTAALRGQFDAADALASLNDDLADNEDRLAKKRQELAQLDATGQSAANDRAAGLKLAAQDALRTLDEAKAGAGKEGADPNAVAKAQLAFNEADRTYRQQAADILDITDERAALLRDINRLEREHAKLLTESLPDAQKAKTEADRIVTGTTSGFAIGSPEEIDKAKGLAAAQEARSGSQSSFDAAQQGLVDAQTAITQNIADTKTAFAAISTAIQQGAQDRTAALQATLGLLSDEKLRQAQVAIDLRKAAVAQAQLPTQVAAQLAKVLADSLNVTKAKVNAGPDALPPLPWFSPRPIAGARAAGGPVMAGQSYIVGEHRPEVFTPEQNGYVAPSVGAASHGDVNVTIVNPAPETASESLNSTLTRLGAFGLLPAYGGAR